MRIAIAAAMAAAIFLSVGASAQEGPVGQVILENSASLAGDLYIDGDYRCGAPPHGSCTADVSAGFHIAMIRFSDGDYIVSDMLDVPGDMSITLPVRDLTT